MCREFIEALERCHASGWNRLTGACNTDKDVLNQCLRAEVNSTQIVAATASAEQIDSEGRQDNIQQGERQGAQRKGTKGAQRVQLARLMTCHASSRTLPRSSALNSYCTSYTTTGSYNKSTTPFTTNGVPRSQRYCRHGVSATPTHRMPVTHSLPVQKLDALLANHTHTPLISSGLPILPIGFRFDHFSSRWGCLSKYAAVILRTNVAISVSATQTQNPDRTHEV